MNKHIGGMIVTLMVVATTAIAADLYVAPSGDDTNAGKMAQPFATIQRARNAIRQRKQGGPWNESVTVWLHGGVYRLRETIVLASADSGTAGTPIPYASMPGERAVLSGGERLPDTWMRTPSKPFWQLGVPAARDGRWVFHSLYVNGQSWTRAQHPNHGDRVLRAEGRKPGGAPRQALRYFPGDVDPSWSNPTDIDVVLLCSCMPTIHRIRE